WFNAVQLGQINAERLGVDVVTDVLSVVTAANFGAAVKNVALNAIVADDITDIKSACTKANWPDPGRSLIVNTDLDTELIKDPALKLALNIGSAETIREGKIRRVMGFDYYDVPTLPDNGENLCGMAVFKSAVGVAFAPVEPA